MMTRTLIEDQCWGIDDEASIQHLGGGGGDTDGEKASD